MEFAEEISVWVWREAGQEWEEVVGGAAANRDTYSKVEVLLGRAELTSRVRVAPVSSHPRMVCLRVELLGCSPAGNTKTLEEVFTLKTLQCQNFRTLNTRHNTIFSQFNIFYFQISLLHPLPKSQK